MFNARKFIQAVGISLLITILTSIILGVVNIQSYPLFIAIQMLATYGSMGYLGAKWNPKTPYFAAYLGAVILSILNFLFAYFIMNVLVFFDPIGINRSMSLAIVLTMLVAVITVFISNKKVGAAS